jgi:hypothetical protein
MGIEHLIEEVAGAIAAEQAVEKVDPNAGVLVKGAAAVAGFVGGGKLADALSSHPQAAHPTPPAATAADSEEIPPDPTLPENAGGGTSA